MRPVLLKLGPWEPWQLGIVFVALVAASLLWRRVERRLDPTAAERRFSWPLTLGGCAAGAVALYLLVNRFAPVEVKSYGVMLLIAFTAGLWWLGRNAGEHGLQLPDIIDLGLTLLIGGVVGARGLYVLLEWGEYAKNPHTVVNVWEGGLSFHGGVLGAILAGLIYCAIKRFPFVLLADLCAAPLALGYSFARIGCFLNGCCQGGPTNLPWGVCFPATTPPGETPVPMQPTQIYASLASLGIFALLVRLRDGYPRRGYLVCTYLVVYSFVRFMLEYTRRGISAELATPAAPDAAQYALAAALLVLCLGFAATIVALGFRGGASRALPAGRRALIGLGALVVAAVTAGLGFAAGSSPALSWLSPLTKGQVASFAISAVMFTLVLSTWPSRLESSAARGDRDD